MTTEHKPATPLPWAGSNSNSARAQGIVQEHTGEDIAIFCGSGKSRMNAAYARHAANAYQQLVAALRKALEVSALHRSMVSKHGFDKTPVEADAEALLRSLGEE